jgi:hypothetical protein
MVIKAEDQTDGTWDEVGEPLLLGEARIVWLEDISKLDYVREKVAECVTRRMGPPYKKDHFQRLRMVGYSELLPETERGLDGFKRRFFFLKEHDRFYEPGVVKDKYQTGSPLMATDPRTVQPNRRGRKTPRSENEDPKNWKP